MNPVGKLPAGSRLPPPTRPAADCRTEGCGCGKSSRRNRPAAPRCRTGPPYRIDPCRGGRATGRAHRPAHASNLPIASDCTGPRRESASEPLAKALDGWPSRSRKAGHRRGPGLGPGHPCRTSSGLIAAAAQSGEFRPRADGTGGPSAGGPVAPLRHRRAGLSPPRRLPVGGLAPGDHRPGRKFEKIFADFGADLPPITMLFLWWRHVGLWILAGLLAVACGPHDVPAMAIGAGRPATPAGDFAPDRSGLALVGPDGMVEPDGRFDPLPGPASVGPAARRRRRFQSGRRADFNVVGQGVARRRSLAEVMSDRREVPASLVPLVRWGETMGNLAERLAPGGRCFRSGSARGPCGCGWPCPRSCLS